MKLYRYLSEEELNYIKANEIDKIGSIYNDPEYKRVSTHKYKQDVKYIHFYFSEKEISRIRSLGFQGRNVCYVCEFEIPFYVIFPYIGIGKYDGHGYKTYLDTVYEVALPAKKMKAKYLKSYTKDESSEPLDLGPIFKFNKKLFEPEYFSDDNEKNNNNKNIEMSDIETEDDWGL